MKSEKEWMIQWTNVNQNLIAASVFFKWKWVFLYQIDLNSRGKLLALFLWKALTEIMIKKKKRESNFTTQNKMAWMYMKSQ